MAALNRLSQRIKENFHETTRDFSLLAGGAASANAAYFDTSDDKVKEISKLLESRVERERLEGMKRIIAGISKGRDMEGFFAQVVKNVVAPSIEIRKLVYIYLLRFSSTNSDLLLLSINTFQKDLSDPSPLIRSMSLRVLTSIRVPVIQGIVMLGLKKLVNDRNPWVRKTVAGGLAKVYEVDPSSLDQLLPLLKTLLSSPSPLTLGASLTAFNEICPERLDLLHPYYRHICRILVDADEWGQVVALSVLTRYARSMLEKPDPVLPKATVVDATAKTNAEESEDEFEGLDIDLAMFLHLSKPLFQSRNASVVLATAISYFHLAPEGHKEVGQQLLVTPLLKLAGSGSGKKGDDEICALTWEVIGAMIDERPALFAPYHARFYLHVTDTIAIKRTKLRSMIALVSKENALASLREFKHYLRYQEDTVAEEAVRAIGHCVQTQPEVAASGLSTLMRLLKNSRENLVACAVIVLKSVILSQISASAASNLPNPRRLVARLARQLDVITNSSARASVYWLVGQFADDDGSHIAGVGWEGLALWVPDVLRKGVKGFSTESTIAKLQILTLGTKLLVLSPATPQLILMTQYLFTLARYDPDYDVRDRSRFLNALLRGVREETKSVNGDKSHGDEEEDEDLGGVVLRREQVKLVMLSKREAAESSLGHGPGHDLEVGSLSRIMTKKLTNYAPLPEWTDDPTDSSLREQEEPIKNPPPLPITSISSSSVPRMSQLSSAAIALPQSSIPNTNSPFNVSPAGSLPTAVKSKFRDLDEFLDSSGEEETGDESESEEEVEVVRPVTAPPRKAIVPEYDEDSSEADDDEDDGSEEEEEEDERKAQSVPLYAAYR